MNDSSPNKKILIVDDEDINQELMKGILEDDYTVHCASNGKDCLEQFKASPPDIVLLDVEMPGLSGYEVCKQIREHHSGADIPILMVTGADDYQSILQAYNIGATDFLPKPLRWPMVAHRVKYMLRSRDAVVWYDATCVITGASQTFGVPDPEDPAPGDLFLYVVGSHSPCGRSTFGLNVDDTPRHGTACDEGMSWWE